MKVVDRKTFLTLPAGTVFCRGGKWHFGELSVKGDSLSNDWSYWSPGWIDVDDWGDAIPKFEEMLETGSSHPGNTAEGRDGRFDDADLFLVFEKADLEFLISRLQNAPGSFSGGADA